MLFLKWYFLDDENNDFSLSLIFLFFVTLMYVYIVHGQLTDYVPSGKDVLSLLEKNVTTHFGNTKYQKWSYLITLWLLSLN